MGIMRDPELITAGGDPATRERDDNRWKVDELLLIAFSIIILVALQIVWAIFGDGEEEENG